MKILPMMASAMSGSMRGITASHNKGGQYFRGRTVPTNPNTMRQSTVRSIFGSLSQDWNSLLTPAERESWNNYAQNVSWTDSLGQNIQLSGINHFVRSNAVALQLNLSGLTAIPIVTTAPSQNDLGVTPTFDEMLTLVHSVGPPVELTAAGNLSNFGMYTDGVDHIVFWLSGQHNPGISTLAGPFVLSGMWNDFAQEQWEVELYDSVGLNNLWETRWGAPQVGMRIVGYARALMGDGRLSGKVPLDFGLVPAAS